MRNSPIPASIALWLLPILAAAEPTLSEFMAVNESGIQDEDGDYEDWIEIRNPGAEPVDLGGWSLTDRADNLTQWAFPEGTNLAAGGYLVVFASNKNRAVAGAELHTNFRLAGGGEFLALVRPDGSVAQAFDPFPPQQPDISYGFGFGALVELVTAGDPGRALTPTGGALGSGWRGQSEPFDDSGWTEGPSGIGFQEGQASQLAHQQDRLLSYWDFDTKIESVVPDRVEGSTHGGLLQNGADLTTGGQGRGAGGEALSGAVGGWMAAGDPERYNFAEDFTWSAWIKGTDGSGAIISRNPAGTAWNQGSKALFVRNNTIQWDSGWVGNPNTGTSATDDAWHHVAVTYRASDDQFDMFVDGVNRRSQGFDVNRYAEDFTHNNGQARTGLFIGQANFSGGLNNLDKYAGLIDDVALYDSPLPAADIALLAAGEPPIGTGAFPGLVATEAAPGPSVYLRFRFQVDDPGAIQALTLDMRYDDGFAAYLNGTPVAASNAPASPDWDSTALAPRANDLAFAPERFDASAGIASLAPGDNILAIHLLNESAAGPEAVALPELTALAGDGRDGYLAEATPGALNSATTGTPAARVTIDPAGATFSANQSVALATDQPDATIFYTTDGSEPDAGSAAYTPGNPISVAATTRLRARAIAAGFDPGPVASAHFVKLAAGSNLGGIEAPTASPPTFRSSWRRTSAAAASAFPDRSSDSST
ncbi:MAG: lamin tail domain-containing protein [Verrucomicrobiales bacterium]